jgi:CheY-like chemotaxis protein
MAPKILVVDDEEAPRLAHTGALERAGYSVTHAASGGDALRQVLSDPPDLVVLDLMLPDVHGVELAGAIRAVAGTARMPMVVVTGFSDAAADLDPKRFGASCVLTKPVTDDELTGAVAHCLTSTVDTAPTNR